MRAFLLRDAAKPALLRVRVLECEHEKMQGHQV